MRETVQESEGHSEALVDPQPRQAVLLLGVLLDVQIVGVPSPSLEASAQTGTPEARSPADRATVVLCEETLRF